MAALEEDWNANTGYDFHRELAEANTRLALATEAISALFVASQISRGLIPGVDKSEVDWTEADRLCEEFHKTRGL